jgi:hypothetical protein
VVATGTSENKLDTSYRLKATETVDLKFGYLYSDRTTTSDRYARAAFSGNSNALGAGVNGGDVLGYYPWFDASRKQQQVRSSANWQTTDKLSFGLGGRYAVDSYDDSLYGVQNGKSWSLNLDSTYAYSDKGAVSLYATQQFRQRDLVQLNAANTTNYWTNLLRDEDLTLGLGVKHSDWFGGKLDLGADLNYVIATTRYSTQVPYQSSTCGAAATYTCGDLPDIKSRSAQLKLTGSYKFDRQSALQLQYIYARFSSSDYYYNAYQYGYTPTTVLPSNQESGNYLTHVIAAMYRHDF